MTPSVHVAVDLGAESGRAVVGRFDGERIALDEVRRFPTRSVRLPDGLYWDALGLYDEVLAGLGAARAASAEVRSVGVDSWAVDFGLLDGRGALLANPLSYRDGRGADELERALELVPADELYAVTGIQFLPINTLYQLLALQRTGALARAETLLLVPDLLCHWLTGTRGAEATNASTTQLYDCRTGGWAVPLVDRLGLPARILPPLVEPGTQLGPLLPHVADAAGLSATTPVVAVASHDTASAVLAAPLAGSGSAYVSSGTWSLVGVELDAPLPTEAARVAGLANERGFGGVTRLLRNVMGLWLVQECRRAWLRDGDAPGYGDLAGLAAAAESGPLFDPDLPELLAPGGMPARISAAIARSGDEPPAGRAELLRAIFESLACKYRFVLERVEEVTGRTIDVVHAIGGGARNDPLCRLTADVTRRPVLAGPVEAAALGNLLAQLHAFGEVSSIAEMREIVRRSAEIRRFEPDPRAGEWDAMYERFRTVLGSEVATS